MSSLSRFCERAIPWLYYLLFFVTPLVLWPKTSEVFEFNKMLTVYTLTTLIITTWLVKSLAQKKLIISKTPLDIPILFLFLSQLASTILSIDPHTSLWGYYSRFHGGLASTVCYLLLYYAYLSNNIDLRYSITSLLSSATLISLYGIAEHFGIDKNIWVQDVQNRVFSTLGQPNWLSAYLAALLPLPIFLGFHQKNIKKNILYQSIALIFFITILFTKSRSGIGATLVVLAISALVISIQKKSWLLPLLFLIITIIPILTNQNLLSDTQNAINKIVHFNQGINKEKEMTRIGGSDSFDIRKIVWRGAIDLGKKYPIFGTGLETFGYTYYWVRPADHNYVSEWEFLYNKAHNEYLNFLANSGFVGLISYLALIIFSLLFFTKQLKKNQLAWPFLLGYISILITNFFGFSVVIIGLFFFIFPALIIDKKNDQTINVSLTKYTTFSIFSISALSLFLLFKIFNTFSSDINYNYGKNYLSLGYVAQSLESLKKATNQSPNEPLYWSQLSEAEAQAAAVIHQQLLALPASTSATIASEGAALQQQYLSSAIDHSQKSIQMNKHNQNFYKTKAKTELILSSVKPEMTQAALHTLLELSALSPTDPKILYNIALVYQNTNQKESAITALQKAISLKPDYLAAKELLQNLNSK